MSIPIPKQYIKDFEQLGLGVFVHFGLYSLLESGEWIYNVDNYDMAEYKKLMHKFNPADIGDLVRDIKKSGAKYITLTTRHHDGFSLYDTCGLNDYDAPHSAAGRDLVREFVDACRKEDIVPFFYHTIIDWSRPDYDTDFNGYLKYLRDSVEILCKNYGKIGGLWFDGMWDKKGDVWQENELYGLIRKYQPDAMIINNTGLHRLGEQGHPEIDSVTFERGNPAPINREGAPKYLTGEVCDSINNHWGIARDFNFKSPKVLIEQLCRCRSAGANYLINVGPRADGTLDAMSSAILEILGNWMNIYGEAVYNGRPFWYRDGAKSFAIKSDRHVYFFCFDLKMGGDENVVSSDGSSNGIVSFEDFTLPVKNIRWMDNGENLRFKQDENNLFINFTGYKYGTDFCVRVAKGDICF